MKNAIPSPVRFAVMIATCLITASVSAQQAPVALIHSPQLKPPADAMPAADGTRTFDIDALPRLAGTDPATTRINAALDRADARALKAAEECASGSTSGSADWNRAVDVTMAGPRFVSFLSRHDMSCGGPHPNSFTIALVYDLTTGRPVDWTKRVPLSLQAKPRTTEGGDGTVLGTLSSPQLKALYIRQLKPEAECREALDESEFDFIFWPDAQADALVMDQNDLGHAVMACGGSVKLPTGMLRRMGADPVMLDAIDAAHSVWAASPAGRYGKKQNGNASLTMTDRGGQWDAEFEAGGIPRGAATAADCHFVASGQVSGNRFDGQVVRDYASGDSREIPSGSTITIDFSPDRATVTQAELGNVCALGVDASGRYTKSITP